MSGEAGAGPSAKCSEDFLHFFAKWWADMDLDKLRASMNDPIWADGKHCGDCTKQPMTCNRCALEDIEKQAADFAQFFPVSVPAQTLSELAAQQGVKPLVTGHELEIPGLTEEDMADLVAAPASQPSALSAKIKRIVGRS